MIITNCSNVIDAFTHCQPLVAIYNYGSLIWTPGTGEWYISWTPTSLSGSFTMWSSTYRLEDYSGLFSWNGSGVIPSSTFTSTEFVTMATNVSCINTNAFQSCSTLVYASIPDCTYIQSGAFMGCNLSYLSFPLGEHIESEAFAYCQNMSSIYLDYSSVCRLDSSDAFQDTYITPYTGSIIVPFSLLDSYRTDSVWSYFFNTIYPSTDSYYIKWTPSVANGVMSFWTPKPLSERSFILSLNISSYTRGYMTFTDYFSKLVIRLESTANITMFETNVLSFGSNCALQSISTLSYVNLYNCENVEWQAFNKCSSLKYANIPKLSYADYLIFGNDVELEYVNIEACQYIDSFVFASCHKLKSINLPYCSYISEYAFTECHSLSKVSIPNCKQILQFAFTYCSSLSEIDLPKVSYISQAAFMNCSNLRKVTLRSTSVVQLYNYGSNTFIGTPLYSGQGSIYVPSSLVSTYKNAYQWRQYSNIIYPI